MCESVLKLNIKFSLNTVEQFIKIIVVGGITGFMKRFAISVLYQP